MRLSERFAVIRLVVIVREVKAKSVECRQRCVSADRAPDAPDKKANLRRNASTRAPATVEGSCSLLGDRISSLPPPLTKRCSQISSPREPRQLAGLYSAARSSATPDAFRS